MSTYTRKGKGMLGWYAYAFAAEPFVVSAVATYVPLLLESLARKNAVLASDHRSPCLVPGDLPGILPGPIAPPKCVVKLGWMWIDTSSLPLYTFSLSVAVQTVVVISISGVADRSSRSRKTLLVGFAILGSVATIALATAQSTHYYAAAALAVVANASFGAVTVCGNAYIPELAKSASQAALSRGSAINYGAIDPTGGGGVDPGLAARRISANGTAVGYAAALFVQVVTMGMLIGGSDSTSRLQAAIMLIGWWWLLGQIPVALLLKSDDDEEDAGPRGWAQKICAWRDALTGWTQGLTGWTEGWVGLVTTVKKARELQDISMFLVGWFLLSDAVTTINSTAVLFARTNLQMATPALALVGLITVVFAIAGSLLFARKSRSLVSIALLGAVIPLYGISGFFQPFIGLNHSWEVYGLASWYGFMLGALNATTRSMYSMLIPTGHEVMFFALYAVTDKGSSILGPTVTGMITDYTHNIRYTFYFLLSMMLLSAAAFSRVDYARGRREVAILDQEERVREDRESQDRENRDRENREEDRVQDSQQATAAVENSI